ncbi:GntR family transcriptional regulator (plasmid) [Coraliomargarita sp. W4R53]
MANPLTPSDPHSGALGDEVFARIGDAIADGTLAPGELIRDHKLAETLGVSRTPVREALQRLERIGLVEVSPHRYTRVAVPNQRAQSDTYEFVAYLMGSSVRMALARCTDDELAAALIDADAVVAASRADDITALNASSQHFFTKVTRASGNVAVLQLVREAQASIRQHVAHNQPFIACSLGRTAKYEEFRAAYAARDGSRAEEVLREINGLC